MMKACEIAVTMVSKTGKKASCSRRRSRPPSRESRLLRYNFYGHAMRVQDSIRESPGQVRRPHGNPLNTRILEASELIEVLDAWRELSAAALVPNPFYEPWILRPAIERIGDPRNLRFLAVFGSGRKNEPAPLWGFFPLELQSRCLKLPIRTLSFWQHRYCFLATPLVHAEHVWDVLEAFWRWFERNPFGRHILDPRQLLAEGPFHTAWSDFAIGRSSFVVRDFPRAFLDPAVPAETYLSRTISKKHYDEF